MDKSEGSSCYSVVDNGRDSDGANVRPASSEEGTTAGDHKDDVTKMDDPCADLPDSSLDYLVSSAYSEEEPFREIEQQLDAANKRRFPHEWGSFSQLVKIEARKPLFLTEPPQLASDDMEAEDVYTTRPLRRRKKILARKKPADSSPVSNFLVASSSLQTTFDLVNVVAVLQDLEVLMVSLAAAKRWDDRCKLAGFLRAYMDMLADQLLYYKILPKVSRDEQVVFLGGDVQINRSWEIQGSLPHNELRKMRRLGTYIKQELRKTLEEKYEDTLIRRSEQFLKAKMAAYRPSTYSTHSSEQTIKQQSHDADCQQDKPPVAGVDNGQCEAEPAKKEGKEKDPVSNLMTKTGLASYEEPVSGAATKNVGNENEKDRTENLNSFDLAAKISSARTDLVNTLEETKKTLAKKSLSLKKWRRQCYDRFAADINPVEENCATEQKKRMDKLDVEKLEAVKEVLAELINSVSENHLPNSGEGPMLIEIANTLEQVDKVVERKKRASTAGKEVGVQIRTKPASSSSSSEEDLDSTLEELRSKLHGMQPAVPCKGREELPLVRTSAGRGHAIPTSSASLNAATDVNRTRSDDGISKSHLNKSDSSLSSSAAAVSGSTDDEGQRIGNLKRPAAGIDVENLGFFEKSRKLEEKPSQELAESLEFKVTKEVVRTCLEVMKEFIRVDYDQNGTLHMLRAPAMPRMVTRMRSQVDDALDLLVLGNEHLPESLSRYFIPIIRNIQEDLDEAAIGRIFKLLSEDLQQSAVQWATKAVKSFSDQPNVHQRPQTASRPIVLDRVQSCQESKSKRGSDEVWRTSSVHLVSVRSGSTSRDDVESIESVMTSGSRVSEKRSVTELRLTTTTTLIENQDGTDDQRAAESVSSGEFEEMPAEDEVERQLNAAMRTSLKSRTKECLHVASSREFVHSRDQQQESDEELSSLADEDVADFIITPIDTPLGACSTTSTETSQLIADGKESAGDLAGYLDLLKESVSVKESRGRHLPQKVRPVNSECLEQLDARFLDTVTNMVESLKARNEPEDGDATSALLKDSEDESEQSTSESEKNMGIDKQFLSTIKDITDQVIGGQERYEDLSIRSEDDEEEEDDVVLERLTTKGHREGRFEHFSSNGQFVAENNSTKTSISEPISEKILDNMDKSFAKTIQGMLGRIPTQTADDGDDEESPAVAERRLRAATNLSDVCFKFPKSRPR